MKKQNWKLISLIVLVILLVITFANWFLLFLPDWCIRVVGVLTLIDIVLLIHTHIKK